MRFEVTILGNGSASPAADKHQTAHVLNVREQFYLIDCGEGTRQRMMRVGVSPLKIRAVFVSHIHGDHVYGLVPLIASLGLAGKRTPLKIFGPAALGRLLDFFQNEFGQPVDFGLEFTPVDTTAHRLVYENRSMEVWSIPLRHRTPTAGYFFREKPDPHNHPTRSYAYLSDTLPSPKAAGLVKGVDLMYHEATFAHADRRLARDTGHSTAKHLHMEIRVNGELTDPIEGLFGCKRVPGASDDGNHRLFIGMITADKETNEERHAKLIIPGYVEQ